MQRVPLAPCQPVLSQPPPYALRLLQHLLGDLPFRWNASRLSFGVDRFPRKPARHDIMLGGSQQVAKGLLGGRS
jgi:hypothetical protein